MAYKAQSTDFANQSFSEGLAQGTGHRAQGTGHRAQSSEFRAQGAERRAQTLQTEALAKVWLRTQSKKHLGRV
jgi:hypothetical protein